MGLPLGVLGVTQRSIGTKEVAACLDPASLILIMDGPGTQVAAALLDPAMVAGLIQQQTMGKIASAPEGSETRSHTGTDAALCAPFIDKLMAQASLLPDHEGERGLLSGYRFGVRAKDPHQAQLVLDANDFTVIEMVLDMAAGTRTGKLLLILPVPLVKAPDAEEGGGVPTEVEIKTNLAENVMGLTAELMIALTRLKMPLQQVSGFRVGDLIDLNLSSMAQALVVDTNGRAIARGTLGQIGGMRAVQVEQHKNTQHTQPRRRAADRDGLDLPDVTASHAGTSGDEAALPAALPSFADVDVFGNLDELPDLPDMEAAAGAADDQMAAWDQRENLAEEEEAGVLKKKQAIW